MQKLKLDLDTIQVASFATETLDGRKGTVNAFSIVVITSNTSVTLGGGGGEGGSYRFCLPEPIEA
jgi:hypothetical protein